MRLLPHYIINYILNICALFLHDSWMTTQHCVAHELLHWLHWQSYDFVCIIWQPCLLGSSMTLYPLLCNTITTIMPTTRIFWKYYPMVCMHYGHLCCTFLLVNLSYDWIRCLIHQRYWKWPPSHGTCLSKGNDLQSCHWQVLWFNNRISCWMGSLWWSVSTTSKKNCGRLASIFFKTSTIKSNFSMIR